jgi:hypothetical protein
MLRSEFARARGVLLNQASKFVVLFAALSMVGIGAQLARAADNGGSATPSGQADAVNQALLKKWRPWSSE